MEKVVRRAEITLYFLASFQGPIEIQMLDLRPFPRSYVEENISYFASQCMNDPFCRYSSKISGLKLMECSRGTAISVQVRSFTLNPALPTAHARQSSRGRRSFVPAMPLIRRHQSSLLSFCTSLVSLQRCHTWNDYHAISESLLIRGAMRRIPVPADHYRLLRKSNNPAESAPKHG